MGRGNYKTTLESRIYPSKTQRGISLYDLALFDGNFRLVITIQRFGFLNWMVGIGKEVHWEMESKRPDPIETVSIGKNHREG